MLVTDVRRRTMQAVRSKDTGPELLVRTLLHSQGYRYRLHRTDLPGKPDLSFPARRKLIFVHGCFWHGHSCPRGARVPKANRSYWVTKIATNRARDRKTRRALLVLGWRSHVVWECELRSEETLLRRLRRFLDS
jgi:DNA mismatch endonuclease, patch repair protein